MLSLDGVRLPGQRRHGNRQSQEPRLLINKELVDKIRELKSLNLFLYAFFKSTRG